MKRFLLDTNHLGEAIGRVSIVRDRIQLAVAERYAEAYHALQRSGRALSQVDILLAAMARHLNATLLTTDKDFQALPDIPAENWLPG